MPRSRTGSYNRDLDRDLEEDEEPYRNRETLYFLFAVLQALGFICIILVCIWTDKYMGGFAWDGSGMMFNWHPVCMVAGFVYFYGNAAVIYRVLQSQPRLCVKIVHASLHACAVIAALIGLIAVFGFHNHNNIPNLYSLHSWVGMTTVVLFVLQLLVGCGAFLWPKMGDQGRRRYLDVHVYFGGTIFIFAIITCISGITEKLFFSLKESYSELPKAGLTGNALGVFIMAFGMLVGYMLNRVS